MFDLLRTYNFVFLTSQNVRFARETIKAGFQQSFLPAKQTHLSFS